MAEMNAGGCTPYSIRKTEKTDVLRNGGGFFPDKFAGL